MAMWLLRLALQHNCIIGKRCKKFHCTSRGYPLDSYKEGGYTHALHFEKITGREKNVAAFFKDLKKDKAMVRIEINNNTVFFLYKTKNKKTLPGQLSHAEKKIFHTKPVFVDEKGYEHWEVCAWNRDDINHFISFLKENTKDLYDFKIQQLRKTKLTEIFFPQVMPKITANQKKALDLALQEGYYDYPRHIELRQLARIMKISLSTYREHLRRAEKSVLPCLQKNLLFKEKN